jgi:hypothetical protein
VFCFDIGTIRLACSLAVYYEKQQEPSEDKSYKGKFRNFARNCAR